MKVIIVGGVAGGASAAARIRRLDENAEITVFEKSGYISYANCGLPYYIGDVITDREELTLQTPESFWSRFRILVRVNCEVTEINPEEKRVSVKNLLTGEKWSETYDKLLLSPGAKPVRPDLMGIDSDRLFTLRTVEDTLRIHDYIAQKNAKSAVIVGGGYIGIEVAENLKERGLDVTIVQRPAQLMNTLDYDMATFVHTKLRAEGVELKLKSNVTGFRDVNDGIATILEDGQELYADIVILAIGVSPENSLAKQAGLELGVKGTIAVNDRMETSAADIYAVGDAVQVKHFVTDEYAAIALAGPANKQGRIAADNICGGDSRYIGSMGSSVIKVFDMVAASTGLTEKAAGNAGIDCDSVILSPSSHAGYYPGAKALTMKVVFEKNTMKLIGAQIVGSDGVDKRIDVLATAINAGIRADKLKDLDLAYAPPFSSAKDPVNMAGFMIENINEGIVKQYHLDEIESLPRDGSVTLLDTRTVREYEEGHIDGYINIPVDDLRDRINELDNKKPVYVMCHSGLRSYIASRILTQNSFDCYNFSGGYRFYESVIREKQMNDSLYPCGMEK
ncbi:MAG: CoA-disulfide reductase [Lachnospiraceae bacterium]